MDTGPVEIVVSTFVDERAAKSALESLKKAEKEYHVKIDDAALLVKDQNGNVRISETNDMGAGKGAAVGGVLGAAVGILTGPVGWAALGGAAIGGLVARAKDSGFPNEQLESIGWELAPGSSALITVADPSHAEAIEQHLIGLGATIRTESIRPETAAQLQPGRLEMAPMETVISPGEIGGLTAGGEGGAQ